MKVMLVETVLGLIRMVVWVVLFVFG
jgi:hypothetical protein